jgi:hypothetical protein
MPKYYRAECRRRYFRRVNSNSIPGLWATILWKPRVELFFNIVWALLSLGLIAFWVHECTQAQGPRRTRLLWQVAALLVLIAVLLPVVSLTDDLQACTTPAEAEHLCRRGAILHFLDSQTNPLPVAAMAFTLAPFVQAPSPARESAPLDGAAAGVSRGFRAASGIRPPPFAA